MRTEDTSELIRLLNARDEARPRRKPHRLPAEAYATADCEYFFTLCARQHGPVFTDPTVASGVVEALLWRKKRHDWTLFCYCLMPDHLHFLVRLPDEQPTFRNSGVRGSTPEGILDHVGEFKSYTTTRVWWRGGGRGALWQKSSYDRIVRQNGLEAAAYVLNNPVRKGLVERWNEYPYSAIVDEW
jgi:REP element-mobilizing transposase RayT